MQQNASHVEGAAYKSSTMYLVGNLNKYCIHTSIHMYILLDIYAKLSKWGWPDVNDIDFFKKYITRFFMSNTYLYKQHQAEIDKKLSQSLTTPWDWDLNKNVKKQVCLF